MDKIIQIKDAEGLLPGWPVKSLVCVLGTTVLLVVNSSRKHLFKLNMALGGGMINQTRQEICLLKIYLLFPVKFLCW